MFCLPIAAMTLATVSLGSMACVPPPPVTEVGEIAISPGRRRRRGSGMATAPIGARRSRGPQAKPKRRSNRVRLSQRVRRKHRRAA